MSISYDDNHYTTGTSYCVLIVDEMYLPKGTQFQSGEYIGENEDDKLYKRTMAFMITGLKNTEPLVIKACPEVTVNVIY